MDPSIYDHLYESLNVGHIFGDLVAKGMLIAVLWRLVSAAVLLLKR